MSDWVIDVIDAAGYPGLAALMFLECVFPPIPSEAILPFVGFAVAEGTLSFPLVIIAATAGSLAGNLLLYVAARRGGVALLARHGHRVGATPERLLLLERWFDRWGSATVLACRAIPLVRSTVSLPAGLARYSLPKFLVLTTLGSAIWNTTLIGLGWALDEQWRAVEEKMSGASYVVLAVLVVGTVVLAVVARRRSRRTAPTSP
ncbi:MAG: DedA family protein [Thermoleophilia bacterium]|nr:DedA family protein [Thermoleophilia bacterium]